MRGLFSAAILGCLALSANAAEWKLEREIADLQIVVVQKKYAGHKYIFEKAARDACGRKTFCRSAVWLEGADVPAKFPMTDEQMASQMVSYTRNRANGTDRVLWRCGSFQGIDPAACMSK